MALQTAFHIFRKEDEARCVQLVATSLLDNNKTNFIPIILSLLGNILR